MYLVHCCTSFNVGQSRALALARIGLLDEEMVHKTF